MSNNKPTLVILAAGMGSRYGGLKQMDELTDEGDTIIDFSIYDAINAGFGKLVFIIRKSFEKEFKSIFNKKLKDKIEIEYVFQENENVPKKFINPNRIKPWGTGHALLMTKDVISGNFAVINADDFYGKEAFKVMAKSLMEIDKNSYNFNMIAYSLKNTVSEYGFVSRGKCEVNEEGFLNDITELTHIEKINGVLKFKDDKNNYSTIDEDSVVSMNFWGFTPKYFEFGNDLFLNFLETNIHNLKAEFYIPSVIKEIINSKNASIKVLKSNAKWFGITYKEDKKIVQNEVQQLKKENIYPKHLWK